MSEIGMESISIHYWIQKYGIKTETGEPLDFHTYRFLFDIYADRSPLICCLKAAQIGFSTYEILTTAFECRNDGIDIIYVLPSDDDVKRFSGGKTNKIIAQNPILGTWTKDKDSTEQKQFGNNTIYYEGAWTERAALSTTAKKLVVDEFDRCKQEVVEQYDSRLQSTANPRKAFFSNPSMPNVGVHKYYLLSDQKKWHVTHSCGNEFVLDESCIDYQTEIFRCHSCNKEITDEERRMGEWKATAQGKWSGYWIPLWLAPWMKASNIAEFKRTKTPEFFANFVAGLPYIGGEDTISPETVLKNVIPAVNGQEGRIVIGVDTGLPIHFTVMNKEGAFYYGKCENYDKLEGFLKRWPESIIVSDQGGDLIGIRQLQKRYPSRVFLCYYRKDGKRLELIKWGEDMELGTVVVDRNRMLQLIVEQLRDTGRFRFNGSTEDWTEFASHFGNIYREQIVVAGGQNKDDRTLYGTEYVWKRNGPDHFVHAFLYALTGMDKYADNAATIIGLDPLQGIQTGRIFDNSMNLWN
jgi:hypothetical protein